MEISLTKKNFEQCVQIGYLYDARQEKTLGMSIFQTAELPKNTYTTIHNNNTDYNFTFDDSFEKKFELLDVSAELKLDIFSGKIKLAGSGAYFNDEKSLASSLKGTIYAKIKTVTESININNKELQQYIKWDALNTKNATHVIVGIRYGANAYATFEYTKKDVKNITKVKGDFESAISMTALSLGAQADVNYEDQSDAVLNSTRINFKADVIPDKEMPQTVQETLSLLKRLPTYIEKTNGGKGVPMMIELLSLDKIIRMFEINLECNRILKKIDLDIIRSVEVEFDNLLKRRQKLNDLIDDCQKYDNYLNNKHKEYLLKVKSKMSICENKFKEDIAQLLFDVRAGLKEPVEIQKKIVDFKTSGYSSDGMLLIFAKKKIRTIQRRIEFLSYSKEAGVMLFEKNNRDVSLFAMSNTAGDKELYVLKISDFLKDKNDSLADKYWKCFLRKKRTNNKDECLFFIFDYELSYEYTMKQNGMLNEDNIDHDEYSEYEEFECKDVLCIEWYSKGRLIEPDCYSIQKDIVKRKANIEYKLVADPLPQNTLSLQIPCPNYNSCPRNLLVWVCKDCDQSVVYCEKLKFYCECGSSEFSNFEYQCTSTRHPEDQFCQFQNLKDLKSFLLNRFYEIYPRQEPLNSNENKKFVWMYKNDQQVFVAYNPSLNRQIERAYSSGQNILILNILNLKFEIDFCNMLETRWHTGRLREIKRCNLELIWASQNAKSLDFDKNCIKMIKSEFGYEINVVDNITDLRMILSNLTQIMIIFVSREFYLQLKNEINNNRNLIKVSVLSRNPTFDNPPDARICRSEEDLRKIMSLWNY